MATKQKSKKQTKTKKSVARKKTKTKATTKKVAIKKTPLKKVPVSAKSGAKPDGKIVGRKLVSPPAKRSRGKIDDLETLELTPSGVGAGSAGQSGSLQGLSDIEVADSESVDELIEEGNAFEAEVVKGVEDAPDADEGEIHIHERPEDDVPDDGEM